MYEFTNDWFKSTGRQNWDALIPQHFPSTILEIGSYEGAATCYLIEKLSNIKRIEITCIDTWEGGAEHIVEGINMSEVERRFDNNINYAINKSSWDSIVIKRKGYSEVELAKLFLEGKTNYYDFIYVDGSHATVDVLSDAILSFKLLKTGGMMVFDDYCWASRVKSLDYFPKMAIDAFTTIYGNKLLMVPTLNTQIAVYKLA